MGKIVSLLLVLFMFFTGYSAVDAAVDKYDEAATVLKPYVPALKRYLVVAEKSQDPEEIAQAMNTLSDSMEDLAPKLQRLTKKYPGIENAENLPARHVPFKNELVGLMDRFTQSYVRLLPLMTYPQIRQANSRMLNIMSSVGATM